MNHFTKFCGFDKNELPLCKLPPFPQELPLRVPADFGFPMCPVCRTKWCGLITRNGPAYVQPWSPTEEQFNDPTWNELPLPTVVHIHRSSGSAEAEKFWGGPLPQWILDLI